MIRLSENALENVSGGVKSFDSLSKDGKVTTSVCAAACVLSFLSFCVFTCKSVAKNLIK